jgi:serine protease Do
MRNNNIQKLIFTFAIAFGLTTTNGLAQQDTAKEKTTAAKDEKDSDRPEKQSRTGTNNLKRLLKIARNSDEMIETFAPVAASASQSTAVVQSKGEQIALGTVVDSNGFILTKASQLDGAPRVWIAGQEYDAQVFGIHRRSDLAMLKIQAENLPVANFANSSPITGSWLACVGPDEDPFSLGTVGVDVRKISATKAFVGIQSGPTGDPEKPGVKITQVVPDSPADKADLWVNDIIIKIGEDDIKEFTDLQAALKKFEPGDRVELVILRGEEKLNISMELADAGNFNSDFERSNQQNRMGSKLSKRRQDFPLAFQHDCGLNANQCGGPLVDLSGQIVGINIARAERVSSLALPTETVMTVIDKLMTGELSPAVINKLRLEEVDRKIVRLQKDLIGLPDEKDEIALQREIEDARLDELNKMKDEVQKKFDAMIADLEKEMKDAMGSVDQRIDELSKEAKVRQVELSNVKKKIVTFKRKIKKLEQSKKDLISGVGE